MYVLCRYACILAPFSEATATTTTTTTNCFKNIPNQVGCVYYKSAHLILPSTAAPHVSYLSRGLLLVG